VTGLTSSAFDFQLVRRGTPPKALKRRKLMTTKCEDSKYLNRQSKMLSMPLHWIPKEFLKENYDFIKTHREILPYVVLKRAFLTEAIGSKELTHKEASEKEFHFRLNDSYRDFHFLTFVDVSPKGWVYQRYGWLCMDRYKGFNHTWEQEAKDFWTRYLLRKPKSFNKILGGS